MFCVYAWILFHLFTSSILKSIPLHVLLLMLSASLEFLFFRPPRSDSDSDSGVDTMFKGVFLHAGASMCAAVRAFRCVQMCAEIPLCPCLGEIPVAC